MEGVSHVLHDAALMNDVFSESWHGKIGKITIKPPVDSD